MSGWFWFGLFDKTVSIRLEHVSAVEENGDETLNVYLLNGTIWNVRDIEDVTALRVRLEDEIPQ